MTGYRNYAIFHWEEEVDFAISGVSWLAFDEYQSRLPLNWLHWAELLFWLYYSHRKRLSSINKILSIIKYFNYHIHLLVEFQTRIFDKRISFPCYCNLLLRKLLPRIAQRHLILEAVCLVVLKFLTASLIPHMLILDINGPEIVVQSSGGLHDNLHFCSLNWLNTSDGISIKRLIYVFFVCNKPLYVYLRYNISLKALLEINK